MEFIFIFLLFLPFFFCFYKLVTCMDKYETNKCKHQWYQWKKSSKSGSVIQYKTCKKCNYVKSGYYLGD